MSDLTTRSNMIKRKLVPVSVYGERLSFQKIPFSVFEKIAIEVECFWQSLTKNHKICGA
jgi:hypothetical protein